MTVARCLMWRGAFNRLRVADPPLPIYLRTCRYYYVYSPTKIAKKFKKGFLEYFGILRYIIATILFGFALSSNSFQ